MWAKVTRVSDGSLVYAAVQEVEMNLVIRDETFDLSLFSVYGRWARCAKFSFTEA
jgi:hypothetical protein